MPMTNVGSRWSSGDLIFYEKKVSEATIADILKIGDDAVTVGSATNDIDFKIFLGATNEYLECNVGDSVINIRSTHTAMATLATYQFLFDTRLTLNTTALASGKYIYVGNFGFYGSGGLASGASAFVLGLGVQGSGTNSGTLTMLRMAVDSGSLFPNEYICFQTASPGVTYLFRVAGNVAPYSGNAGTYTTADGYLLVSTPGGDRRIPLYAGTD